MDLHRLSAGDRLIGVSGIFLFAVSFTNWLGIEITGAPVQFGEPATWSFTRSAWSFPVTMVAVVLGLAMTAVVVMKLFGVGPTRIGPFAVGQALLVVGVTVFVLIVVKLIAGPDKWNLGGNSVSVSDLGGFCRFKLTEHCQTFNETRGAGIFLGAIAGLGLLVGGYLRNQEDTAPAPTTRARATASA